MEVIEKVETVQSATMMIGVTQLMDHPRIRK